MSSRLAVTGGPRRLALRQPTRGEDGAFAGARTDSSRSTRFRTARGRALRTAGPTSVLRAWTRNVAPDRRRGPIGFIFLL
ncbi:hypothetical protein NJ7G_0859 [Natrinema sp. J7-2]|nr:hypothetical protein NJ7G_0859 [Natrinema sp. J7-2]